MSRPVTRFRGNRRGLGIFAAGAVVAGLLAATPAADAAGSAGTTNPGGAAAPSTTQARSFTPGHYIVLLRAPSAAAYDGGNARYRATRPVPGGQFRADTPAVRAYADHLRATQANIARGIGARVDQSYTVASNGFSAELTTGQAMRLQADRRVLLVEKDSLVHADAWNTSFLGLTGRDGAWATHGGHKNAGSGVVVADIDSGIWPESKSFAGQKLTRRAQTEWDISRIGRHTTMRKADGGVFHGVCEVTDDFTRNDCSTKLIGARSYSGGYVSSGGEILDEDFDSPRDGNGHGSHTASTAAGDVVHGVAVEGVRFGTVTGIAPAARIAAYKVLWAQPDGTASGATSDIVAAIDDAVSDGADVINYSISGSLDTVVDAAEIAFEGAAKAGVFVSASAGNEGPDASSVNHPSPWLTTVAATTYHNFDNTLVLGDGTKLVGASINNTPVPSKSLVNSTDAVVAGGDADDATLCGPDTLDPAAVSGKIVVCTRGVYDRVAKSAEVARAGGAAMVLVNPSPNSLDADFHSVPTVHIDDQDGKTLFDYLGTAGDAATASIQVGNTTDTVTPLPQVAGFSSRGPSAANGQDLLKPDISAPGVSVLAAVAPPSNSDRDYDLYSGTSMAAPHISGLAAFMASVHPTWSPMQVKSAMMTTATSVKDADGNPSDDLFGEGAGQVTPKKFFEPGLFVTSDAKQWDGFLTGQGFFTGVPALAAKDLNGPSMAQGAVTSSTSFKRTFTADRQGTWKVSVSVPGFDAQASAPTLHARGAGDHRSLTFQFRRTDAPLGEYAFGWVTLTGPTTVRLPVALRPLAVAAPGTVTGTGTSGTTDVTVRAGFTGDLQVTPVGLAKAQKIDNTVAPSDYQLECVQVTEGTKLARFDLDAGDDTADLDMFVYHSASCDTGDIDAQVGQSATGSADESVTLTDPQAGAYLIEVDGFAAGSQGAPMGYQLRFFDVDAAATLGDLTVTPDPVPVQENQEATFQLGWSGLDAGESYLGLLQYEGSTQPTLVEITS